MSETKEYSIPELVKRIAEEAPLFFSNIGKDWAFIQGEYEEFIDSLLQSHKPSVTREEIQSVISDMTLETRSLLGYKATDKLVDWLKSKGIPVEEK